MRVKKCRNFKAFESKRREQKSAASSLWSAALHLQVAPDFLDEEAVALRLVKDEPVPAPELVGGSVHAVVVPGDKLDKEKCPIVVIAG